MFKPKDFPVRAGVLALALAVCPLQGRADTAGETGRDLVFRVEGLGCPAVKGLG
jgi:hypothetical protein